MARDITRRTLIAASAAFAAAPGRANALGLPAGPDVLGAFSSLQGISEGRGRATLHVLFAPWCHVSPTLYRESRGILDRLTLRWIPMSGGQPEGKESAEVLLRNMDPALVPSAFVPLRPLGVAMRTPLCDQQDAMVSRLLEPLLIRDTGRPLTSPTLAYRYLDDRVRVIPAGLSRDQLRQVAELAS